MKTKALPSVAELNRLFSYDPETGILRRRLTNDGHNAGDIAGGIGARGYYQVKIGRSSQISVHRIIWKMMTWKDPVGDIDHANGDTLDNRWANLREATRSQNQYNSTIRTDNKTGCPGVTFHKASGHYSAAIRCKGKRHWLGTYTTFDQAADVYRQASLNLHGEFSRFAGALAPKAGTSEDNNDIILVIDRVLQDYGTDRRLHAVLHRARSEIVKLRIKPTGQEFEP